MNDTPIRYSSRKHCCCPPPGRSTVKAFVSGTLAAGADTVLAVIVDMVVKKQTLQATFGPIVNGSIAGFFVAGIVYSKIMDWRFPATVQVKISGNRFTRQLSDVETSIVLEPRNPISGSDLAINDICSVDIGGYCICDTSGNNGSILFRKEINGKATLWRSNKTITQLNMGSDDNISIHKLEENFSDFVISGIQCSEVGKHAIVFLTIFGGIGGALGSCVGAIVAGFVAGSVLGFIVGGVYGACVETVTTALYTLAACCCATKVERTPLLQGGSEALMGVPYV